MDIETEQTKTQQVLDIARRLGMLRPRDLEPYQIPAYYPWRMAQRGLLERVDRGLYVLPGADMSEHHSLAEAAKQVPHGVICLLSALRFHGLTTQNPQRVWMAIEGKRRLPRVETPSMRFVRFSGQAFSAGVETQRVDKVPVQVYSPAKTVADCFKYRNKVGLDVAMEALRDCLAARRDDGTRLCSVDDLWRYARICRVANVMRPYLEAMTA